MTATATPATERVQILGVEYRHIHLPEGDDLYLTEFGEPYAEQLHPQAFWTDRDWFREHSVSLFGHLRRYGGTSSVYRVTTKPMGGRSLEIVLKWNRMGQDIPGAETSDHLQEAEFNSPYEEFALVLEMRQERAPSVPRLRTHKPLAIFVPGRRLELWQSGRQLHRMQNKIRSHGEFDLDIFRSYGVIYEWIKGIDAAEALDLGVLTADEVAALTLRVERDMRALGFWVRDRKPQHVIVRRRPDGTLLRDRHGEIPYATIDFELLERTPERQEQIKRAKRRAYLERQARRFQQPATVAMPAHLKAMNIMGVDYVYGQASSTQGELWVVGRDPGLFDYFLPERWERTPRTKLSVLEEVYHTLTKDNIQLVWRLSRVGQQPYVDPFRPDERRVLQHGYNSPFEEVALALELQQRGIPTTYPRAIYMTGHTSQLSDHLCDDRRYESHAHLLTPDGLPILRKERDYIVIWGYYNKPDEMLAVDDGSYYQAMDALQALHNGVLTEEAYLDLMKRTVQRLAEVGMEDLHLRGSHLTLALANTGQLVCDPNGYPAVRICSFDMMRRLHR